MRTVLAQVPSAVGDKEENLRRIHETVSGQEADLFVFPELFLSGYMCRDRVHLMAESIHGESVQELATVADEHQCSILLGMPTLDDETTGLVHNSAVLVKPDGSAWSYDKINLATFGPFEESLYFAPGNVPTLFEVEGFRLGVVDLLRPVLPRAQQVAGAARRGRHRLHLRVAEHLQGVLREDRSGKGDREHRLFRLRQQHRVPAQPGLLRRQPCSRSAGQPIGQVRLFQEGRENRGPGPVRGAHRQADAPDGP